MTEIADRYRRIAGIQARLDDPVSSALLVDGPRVEVPADADEQVRLIPFSGRQP